MDNSFRTYGTEKAEGTRSQGFAPLHPGLLSFSP